MKQETSFEALWNRNADFTFTTEQVRLCGPARAFLDWADGLCEGVLEEPHPVTINQAKLLLLDKYFEWKAVVSKAHRTHLGTRGHGCIFYVFDDTYKRLKAAELSLTPPPLALPAPPSLPGIYLGEDGGPP